MNKIKSTTQTETPNISNVVWSCRAKEVSFHSIRGRNTVCGATFFSSPFPRLVLIFVTLKERSYLQQQERTSYF